MMRIQKRCPTQRVTLAAAPISQLTFCDENANIFPTDCVALTVSSFQPVGDEDIKRCPTECITSAASSFQLSAGDENANIFPTECVASTVPVGDKNVNRSTDCVTSAASSFQLSAGDENANISHAERVASTVPSFELPVFDNNINRSLADCVTSEAPSLLSVTCPYCAKCFQRSDNLNRHISVFHTTNKPYECQQCAKRFSTENQYNVHIRRHENKCPYCPEVFRVRKYILKHVVLCHKDRDPSSLAWDTTTRRFSQGKFSWGMG